MFQTKATYIPVLLFCLLFVYFQMNNFDLLAHISSALVVPFIAMLYIVTTKEKSRYLLASLVAFSVSELFTFLKIGVSDSLNYYVGNILYIIAYLALIIEIVRSMDFKALVKYFRMYLVVFLILNIYANYYLINIVKDYVPTRDFSVELVYNIFTILLLTVSVVNYFFRFDKKSLLLFLGALLITLSEAFQIAYYYLVENGKTIKVVFYMLIFAAYYLFYFQSKYNYDRVMLLKSNPIK